MDTQIRSLFRCRLHYPGIIAVEEEWFSNKSRTAIGAILLDSSDEDWSYVVLEKDADETFRWNDGEVSLDNREITREKLIKRMEEID